MLNSLSHNHWRKIIARNTTTTKQATEFPPSLSESILGSFCSNCSNSSHFTNTLIQSNEYWIIMINLIYLSQNNATIRKSSELCNFKVTQHFATLKWHSIWFNVASYMICAPLSKWSIDAISNLANCFGFENVMFNFFLSDRAALAF